MPIKVLVMAHHKTFKYEPVRGIYYLAAIPRVGKTVLVFDRERGLECQFKVLEVTYFAFPEQETREHTVTVWGDIVESDYQE